MQSPGFMATAPPSARQPLLLHLPENTRALASMLRSLPYIALAAAAIAGCLLGFSWLMSIWIGRHLSLGELAVSTVLLLAALAYGLSVLRLRNRRKVQDMRDSALW